MGTYFARQHCSAHYAAQSAAWSSQTGTLSYLHAGNTVSDKKPKTMLSSLACSSAINPSATTGLAPAQPLLWLKTRCDLQVDLVLVPAVTGDFGVMPGHVPTVAQLRPGVVTVHNELDKDVEKYFVSSGFAFVHADSTADVVAVEAVKLDELDTEAVRAGLQARAFGSIASVVLRARSMHHMISTFFRETMKKVRS